MIYTAENMENAVRILRQQKLVTEDFDTTGEEKEVLVSRIWRVYQGRRSYRDQTTAPGTAVVDTGRVLSLKGVASNIVQSGDVAVLPSGERLRIVRVRPYPTGLQCDIESGDQQKEAI